MKQNFKKTLKVSKQFFRISGILSFVLATCTMNVKAQSYKLNQVIVLNDGNILSSGGQHTRVGSYNPVTKVYQDFDTIAAKYGSHVIIDSGYIYVGADSLLIKYDLNTHAKLATQTVVGIREMAVWGKQILVTTGTTFPLKSYFLAYNKSNLSLAYQDTTISHATEGIQVLHDSAYIAINDFGSGSIGKLGVVDLHAQKEKHEVDLGPTGLNPYSVFVEPNNQKIYTVNNLVYNNSSVTKYDAPSTTFNNNSLHLTAGCTGSVFYQGNVYFEASNDDNIGVFSATSLSVWDSLKIHKYVYGMGIDSADGYMYVGQTDYVSYGNVFIYDLFGHAIDSFAVDVSPGNFAFDVRTVTGIPTIANPVSVNVYPNPTSSMLNVTIGGNVSLQKIIITDALGKTVCQKLLNNSEKAIALNIANYSSGIYFLTVQTTDGTLVHNKIVKQ